MLLNVSVAIYIFNNSACLRTIDILRNSSAEKNSLKVIVACVSNIKPPLASAALKKAPECLQAGSYQTILLS